MGKKKKNLRINLFVLLITILLFLLLSEAVYRLVLYANIPKEDYYYLNGLEGFKGKWESFYINPHASFVSRYAVDKEEDVFRIAVVGDSFTYGYGKENGVAILDKAYPLQLEALLNNNFDDYKYEVLNFGFGGATPLEEHYILREVALKYEPDLVIMGITSNDADYGIHNLDPIKYCDINLTLCERLKHSLYKNWRLFSYLSIRLSQREYFYELINPENPIGQRCFERSLKRIKKELGSQGVPNFVVFIPVIYYTEGSEYFYDYYPDFSGAVSPFNQTMHSLGFDVVHVYPYLSTRSAKDLLSEDLHHYNSKTNLMFAEIIYTHLLTQRLLPGCELEDCSLKLIDTGLGSLSK